MKRLILGFFVIIGLLFFACSDYKLEKDHNGEWGIVDYRGKEKNLVIPDTIKEKKITFIGGSAFSNKKLTGVTIPDSVTYISVYAFSNNELTNVIIPDSVINLGVSAFENNQLTSVIIPNSITEINEAAFLKNQLTSVIIPDSITSIYKNAFSDNQLTSVTIPDSVTSIGEFAFLKNQLTSVTIPNSVKFIYRAAFRQNQLTNVLITGSDVRIESNSFDDDVLINGKTIQSYRDVQFVGSRIYMLGELIINYNNNTAVTNIDRNNSTYLDIKFNDDKRKTGTMIIKRILNEGKSYSRVYGLDKEFLFAVNDSFTFVITDNHIMEINFNGSAHSFREEIIINRTY